MRVGVAAIARPTFDVPFAAETARAAFARLDALGWQLAGSADLLMDAADVDEALADLAAGGLDGLVVLQASFADSTLVRPLAALGVPMALWAFPEERTGGRLRLNSLCGINLAGYALAASGIDYGYVYRAPDDPLAAAELSGALLRRRPQSRRGAVRIETLPAAAVQNATVARGRLGSATIGLIGDHPTGFEPCAYEPERLAALGGVTVERIELDGIFAAARAVPEEATVPVRILVRERLDGVDEVDQGELDDALRLNVALEQVATERRWAGLAMRCWPECFTEYGSAACAAQAMLSDRGIPGCCEADVYGNLTSLALQWLGGGAAFVADLVELDRASDTGVLWHCGIAPYELADPQVSAAATIHSNRRKPLLHEFALKPGRVTLARFSQARGEHALVVGGGEAQRAPISFSGTSAVVKFDAPVDEVLAVVMGEGLEHHFGLAYGDIRADLRALASLLDLPVIELTP